MDARDVSPSALFARLQYEVRELELAVGGLGPTFVMTEASAVAELAMQIWEAARRERMGMTQPAARSAGEASRPVTKL